MPVKVRWLALAFVPAVLVAQQDTTFATASEPKLDSLYGPLVYLMKADERGRYGSLTVEGKRSFLRPGMACQSRPAERQQTRLFPNRHR